VKLEKLGEGSFGQIWLVRSTQKGGTFVLKEMALGRLSAKEVAACRLEVDVLKRFDHPSIITFVSSFEEPGMLGIIMEYASSGDLQRLIDERVADGHAHLPEWRVKAYALQLGHAVHYLHTYMLLLHRDIKPANVFLAPSGEVRLGDFGMCRLIVRTTTPHRPHAHAAPQRRSLARSEPAKHADESRASRSRLALRARLALLSRRGHGSCSLAAVLAHQHDPARRCACEATQAL
jgi:serine/threonine protein kinase